MQTPHTQRLHSIKRFIIDVLSMTLQSFLLLVIFLSMFGRFEVQQTSMEPNLHAGQRVMVNKLGTLLPARLAHTAHAADDAGGASPGFLKRGQVVVFYATPYQEQPPLIKRLIGLPGDTIEIHDGHVSVNGVLLDEPYTHGKPTICYAYCGPLTLKPDEYFFLGDNRPDSRDSRSFGAIPANQIIGPVILRYWPLDHFSTEL